LAKLSRPRLKLNAAGLTPAQTALGNRIAKTLRNLDPETVAAMHALLDEAAPIIPEQRRDQPGRSSRKGAVAAGRR
jgi:hypothetical protein